MGRSNNTRVGKCAYDGVKTEIGIGDECANVDRSQRFACRADNAGYRGSIVNAELCIDQSYLIRAFDHY
ncbi:MAG: hypothetical protein LBR52_00190 [Prevotellaceae bacterium]|nr:hypothetical protein [Prevotellaceae bacterium]